MRRYATVLAFLAIPAALFFPHAWASHTFHAQKRTVTNLHRLATALEIYARDHNAYPRADSCEQLRPVLVRPFSQDPLACADEWGHPFRYVSDTVHFEVASPGRNGTWWPSQPSAYGDWYDLDLIYRDGRFVSSPPYTAQGGEDEFGPPGELSAAATFVAVVTAVVFGFLLGARR